MEFFLAGTPPVIEGSNGVAWRYESTYAEAKVRLAEHWLPVYVFSIEDGVLAAATCWNDMFDRMIDELFKHEALYPTLEKLYPTAMNVIENARSERYGDGALLQFIDPDDMYRKWFISVLVPGLFADDLTADKTLLAAMDKTYRLGIQVGIEAEAEPTATQFLGLAGRGALEGYRERNKLFEELHDCLQWLSLLREP